MIDALYIGATGMAAQQTTVDTISNNLANVNTPTYKKSRVSFEDLVYRPVVAKGVTEESEEANIRLGTGVAVTGISKQFALGELKKTENSLDVAIKGAGFLEVIMPDGSTAYTRAGTLAVNKEGLLSAAGGNALAQMIRIPPDAKQLFFDADGTVRAILPNEASPAELGQIELALFSNPGGLNPSGDNLYTLTDQSGQPLLTKPGSDGSGALIQGYLESSNVQMVEEMVNLMLAQRAYEVNAKIVQAADEILAMTNNLRR